MIRVPTRRTWLEERIVNHRKAVVVGVAAFAIGAAFAAQPVSVRADRDSSALIERSSWAPGTNGVMAAYETSTLPVAPPQ
jgi:hypothetical protein